MRAACVKAWLLCGTLDILYAAATSLMLGRSPLAMLRAVASGPFGDGARDWGLAGSALGLTTHFGIMAAMVAAGFWLARKTPLGEIAPWKAGTLYGLVLYGVMAGIVLQMRFGSEFPSPDKLKLANELFPHVVLVGIPIFMFARRAMNTSPPA
ncbi:MAG: hypothetical protein ABL914_12725 [Novosphingobium sp.]|uniref:hypothetical protein n=1 Tax=Novosphingobium sp. TaxID=1874826 RepID=UPI0032BE53C1